MILRKERKEETREKLLTAAAACFAKKGYSGCSVSDIVAQAGVSQGTLYVHFKNKEDLFISMIAEEHGQGAEKAQQAAASASYLQGIIEVMEDCVRNVGFPVDHRLWTEILAVAARDETVRKAFAASDKAMHRAFVELLEKAVTAGEIDGSLNLDSVSLWLYALVDGLIARTADDSEFDFTKHIAVFEILVRRALRP